MTEAPTENPTATQPPTPVATATETATAGSPQIVPIGGATLDPDTAPIDDTPTPTVTATETPVDPTATASSPPRISPLDQTPEAPEPTLEPFDEPTETAEPAVFESPTTVDEPTVAPVGSGVAGSDGSSADLIGQIGDGAIGPLVYSGAADAFTFYTGPGGDTLAIYDRDAQTVSVLGAFSLPVWSADGSLLVSSTDGIIFACVPATLTCSQVAPPDAQGRVHADVPAGWLNGDAVYQRLILDGSGVTELRQVGQDGTNDRLLWTGVVGTVYTDQPVQLGAASGFLLASDAGWLMVDPDGTATTVGSSPGPVGRTLVGPGGRFAYVSGGQVVIATTGAPGAASGTVPYAGGPDSGFDFSPTGDRLVVSDGTSFNFYDTNGAALSVVSPSNAGVVGAPLWFDPNIWFISANGALYRLAGPDA
ncbi:MAG: hypothetical protein M3R06_07855 [Chloroflexota bacterium]|nr:hypothetical protein [Chloroflexota bacterium]